MKYEIIKDIRTGQLKDKLLQQSLGTLILPTGQIMINDPLVMYEQESLEKDIKPGSYPVYLYVYEEFKDKRTIFAEIRFLDTLPIKIDEVMTFDIDSGIAAFVDGSIFDKLETLSEEQAEDMWNNMNSMLEDNKNDSYTTMNYQLDDINIIGFTSGYGNGTYSAYYAYDASHNLCSLFIDFNIVDYKNNELVNQRYFDFGEAIDEGWWHYDKVKDDKLPLDRIVGYNHLAIFLRWMCEHKLLSKYLLTYFPTLPSIIEEGKEDIRVVIDSSPIFNGELCVEHFNNIGKEFVSYFYRFNMHSTDYYPTCVDDFAENYFGTEKYNCEEFHDEAYLFVPYDEEYYQGLSKYIDKNWEKFNKNDM